MASANEYFESARIQDIPVPAWDHLGATSPVENPTLKLNWDQIYIGSFDDNETKVDPHTPAEIESLRLSFAANVDPSQFPPAVKHRGYDSEGNEYPKPWRFVYGYGRSEALRQLQTKGWFFTVLEGTDDAIEDVQAQENEQLPKRVNKEIDMRKFLINKVNRGTIKKTEKAIRAKFKKVYPYQKKEVENRVVPQVLADLGVESPYYLFTSTPKIQDWLNNHSREDYKIKQEYDPVRKMHGIIMKEGYQWRAVCNAVLKYFETGHYSYVIFHCGAPTKKADFAKKRRQVLETFERFRQAFAHCGMTTWPIVILGALPQDRDTEDLRQIITVSLDQDEVVLEPNWEVTEQDYANLDEVFDVEEVAV